MKNKIVNKYFIIHDIGSVSFSNYYQVERSLDHLDESDEIEVKGLIKFRMLILHLMKPPKFQQIFKDSLRYYLSTNHIDFEELFRSGMPSFDLPTPNYRDFFIWVWEVYYGGEDYLIDDISEYVENNDEEMAEKVFYNR